MGIIAYLHGFTYSLLTNDRPIREGKEKERNSDNHYKCSHLGWCHREQKLGIVSVPSPIPPPSPSPLLRNCHRHRTSQSYRIGTGLSTMSMCPGEKEKKKAKKV